MKQTVNSSITRVRSKDQLRISLFGFKELSKTRGLFPAIFVINKTNVMSDNKSDTAWQISFSNAHCTTSTPLILLNLLLSLTLSNCYGSHLSFIVTGSGLYEKVILVLLDISYPFKILSPLPIPFLGILLHMINPFNPADMILTSIKNLA